MTAPSRLRRLVFGACFAMSSAAVLSIGCVDFSSLTSGEDGGGREATAPTKDSSPGPSDASGPFCSDANTHSYCFDFDESPTVDIGWFPGPFVSPPEGVLTLDTVDYVSPPHGIDCYADSGLHGGGTYVQLQQNLTAGLTGVVLSADLRIADFQGLSDLKGALLKLWYSDDATACEVTFGFDGTTFDVSTTYPRLDDDGGIDPILFGTEIAPLSAGVWTRVDMKATFNPWKVEVDFDGVPQAMIGSLPRSTSIPGARILAGVGPIVTDAGGPIDVSYDNVTIDEQP